MRFRRSIGWGVGSAVRQRSDGKLRAIKRKELEGHDVKTSVAVR